MININFSEKPTHLLSREITKKSKKQKQFLLILNGTNVVLNRLLETVSVLNKRQRSVTDVINNKKSEYYLVDRDKVKKICIEIEEIFSESKKRPKIEYTLDISKNEWKKILL